MPTLEELEGAVQIEAQQIKKQEEVQQKKQEEEFHKHELATIDELRDLHAKQQLEKFKREEEVKRESELSMAHSRPLNMREFVRRRAEEITQQMGQNAEWPFSSENIEVDVSPSIHHIVKGETFLANIFDLKKDSEKSYFVNDFILTAMEAEELEDSPGGYNKVLNKLRDRMGLTGEHKKDFILSKIYYYLIGRDKYHDDDLIMSIMRNKTRHRIKGS